MNAFNESQALVLEIDISNDSVLNESSSLSMDREFAIGSVIKDVLPDSTYMHLDLYFVLGVCRSIFLRILGLGW